MRDYVSDRMGFDGRNSNQYMTTTFYNQTEMDYFSNGYKLEPSTDIFNSNMGGKEHLKSGMYFSTNADKYTNKDGTISKGGLLVGIINQNLDVTEGETTYIGSYVNNYDKNLDAREYDAQIKLWRLNHDPKTISKSEYNNLSDDMKKFVDFTRRLNGLPAQPQGNENQDDKDQLKIKDPLALLFEQINKDRKEMLKHLAKKAEENRLEQIKAMRENLQGINLKDLSIASKNSLEDMLIS